MFWGAHVVYFNVENSRVRMLTESGDDEFEEFVRVRADGLYGTALLLTGDRHLAEDLLQTALTQAWRAWDEITTSHEGYVRRILVNTYVSWWRRKWNGERPTDVLPEEPQATATRLRRLTSWVQFGGSHDGNAQS